MPPFAFQPDTVAEESPPPHAPLAIFHGSANLTDTSLNCNFELGVYIEDRDVIARLHALFDYVFDFSARPAAQI